MPPADPQLEFLGTFAWALLSCWTFGFSQLAFVRTRPGLFPPAAVSGPSLFFALCVGWYETGSRATTNPSYWVKDLVADWIARRVPRKAPPRRALLMSAVDVCGWVAALWVYVRTLRLLGVETAMVDAVVSPPRPPPLTTASSNGASSVVAFVLAYAGALVSEVLVTTTTQLSPVLVEALTSVKTGTRLNNVLASAVGIQVMLWGMPVSGAVMNPASSLAATFWWLRATSSPVERTWGAILVVVVVYVVGSCVGGVLSGIVEGLWLLSKAPSPSPVAVAVAGSDQIAVDAAKPRKSRTKSASVTIVDTPIVTVVPPSPNVDMSAVDSDAVVVDDGVDVDVGVGGGDDGDKDADASDTANDTKAVASSTTTTRRRSSQRKDE